MTRHEFVHDTEIDYGMMKCQHSTPWIIITSHVTGVQVLFRIGGGSGGGRAIGGGSGGGRSSPKSVDGGQ